MESNKIGNLIFNLLVILAGIYGVVRVFMILPMFKFSLFTSLIITSIIVIPITILWIRYFKRKKLRDKRKK